MPVSLLSLLLLAAMGSPIFFCCWKCSAARERVDLLLPCCHLPALLTVQVVPGLWGLGAVMARV